MADKQAITEILGKMGWAYDSGNLDYFEEVFTDDGRVTLSILGQGQVGDFQGKETIMGLYRGAKASQSDQRRHCVTNVFFPDTTATTATVISYLTLFAAQDGAVKLLATGVYTDQFVLQNGAWKVAHRDIALDAPY